MVFQWVPESWPHLLHVASSAWPTPCGLREQGEQTLHVPPRADPAPTAVSKVSQSSSSQNHHWENRPEPVEFQGRAGWGRQDTVQSTALPFQRQCLPVLERALHGQSLELLPLVKWDRPPARAQTGGQSVVQDTSSPGCSGSSCDDPQHQRPHARFCTETSTATG